MLPVGGQPARKAAGTRPQAMVQRQQCGLGAWLLGLLGPALPLPLLRFLQEATRHARRIPPSAPLPAGVRGRAEGRAVRRWRREHRWAAKQGHKHL